MSAQVPEPATSALVPEPLPPSIAAPAFTHQVSAVHESTAASASSNPTLATEQPKDVNMLDSSSERPASPAVLPGASNVPSPQPPRISTPSRMNGADATSRATSQHPDPTTAMPREAPPHGAPARRYLNSKLTGAVMDGMKIVAKERPTNPLRVLGEYLLMRSKEIEGP